MPDRPGPLGSLAPSPMALLIIEAVERVASPDARDSVMQLALADGGLTTVPEDPVAFRRFVVGPLKRSMELALGMDLAHAVLSDLSPIVERAATTTTSGVRTRAKSDRELLVVLTNDAGCADALAQVAAEHIDQKIVGDLFELLRVVEALGHGRVGIVVDCSLPSVRPAGLATLARIVPPSIEVVLWGWDRVSQVDLDLVTLPERWVRLDADAEPIAVIERAFPDASLARTDPPPPIEAEPPRTVAIVVHENALSRAALASALGRAGYEVVTAPDAYLAVDLVRQHAPAVIVADEALPRVDGAKILRLSKRITTEEPPFAVLLAAEPLPFRDPAIDLVIDEAEGADAIVAMIEARRGR